MSQQKSSGENNIITKYKTNNNNISIKNINHKMNKVT